MIIHQPESRKENGQFIVSARIEHNHEVDFPSEPWFSVDEEYEPLVSARSDLFASTLIRVARSLGEDIEVRGELSPQLLFGLREYLIIHAVWSGNPNIINLTAKNPTPAKRSSSQAVASCNMSGGIDSFYTLWSQLPENEPATELQIKYGIYGIGLSSPKPNNFLRNNYVPELQKCLNGLGVKLLVVDSNLAQFGYHESQWLSISTARIAIPSLFSPMISTHFVPSSVTYETQRPWGTNPLTDHLFSLESLSIFTHTSDLVRFEKFREISNWSPFYDYLQICNNAVHGVVNDCTCTKCTRTMLMAKVLGIDDRLTTFHLPFQRKTMLRRIIKVSNQYLDFKMMAAHARRLGKFSLLPFIYFPMVIYKLTNWMKPLLGYKFR